MIATLEPNAYLKKHNPRGKKPRKGPSAKVRNFIQEQVDSGGKDIEGVRQLLREKCKTDLWYLSYHVLGFPDVDTTLHVDMCARNADAIRLVAQREWQ